MAAPKIDLKIDTSQFMAMVQQLAAIDPAVDYPTVLRHEVAAVVHSAMTKTKAAKAGKIRASHAKREWITTLDGKKVALKWRFPRLMWKNVRSQRRTSLKIKLASRGLAKRSWISAYKTLGVPPHKPTPTFVENANYRGNQFDNARTRESRPGAAAFSIKLVNPLSYITTPGAAGRSALIKAVNGRTQFFRHNMEHAFYRTLKSRATKYPGIFVTP